MSTAVVRSVLCSFLTDQDCLEGVERFKGLREEVRQFVQMIAMDDTRLSLFDDFASSLMKMLEKCFFSCITEDACRSKYVQREKVWAAFHRLRLQEAVKLWQDLFCHGFPRLSPVVYQQVNQKLYSDLINCHLSTKIDNNTVAVPALTSDEANILRYAAGYVPFKLLNQYEKSLASESTVGIIECLAAMAVNGEESTVLEYTRKWIDLVNRGGLFEINDTAFDFFKEIEMKVRKKLLMAFDTKVVDQDNLREGIVDSTASDDDVLFFWTLLSVDIETEDQATKVLRQIIGLWITIRGHSIAGTWLEQYKQYRKKKPSGKKGLRTELKRATQTPDCTD